MECDSKVVISVCVEAVECGFLKVAESGAAVFGEGCYEVCEVAGAVAALFEGSFSSFV